jgi:hypothetical protein
MERQFNFGAFRINGDFFAHGPQAEIPPQRPESGAERVRHASKMRRGSQQITISHQTGMLQPKVRGAAFSSEQWLTRATNSAS